jgi:hypothetical protein
LRRYLSIPSTLLKSHGFHADIISKDDHFTATHRFFFGDDDDAPSIESIEALEAEAEAIRERDRQTRPCSSFVLGATNELTLPTSEDAGIWRVRVQVCLFGLIIQVHNFL